MKGDYGLTQFAYAIVDKPENLPKLKEAFDSKEFRNLMELCAVGQLTVNHKIISIFKKEFWKLFISKSKKLDNLPDENVEEVVKPIETNKKTIMVKRKKEKV